MASAASVFGVVSVLRAGECRNTNSESLIVWKFSVIVVQVVQRYTDLDLYNNLNLNNLPSWIWEHDIW